MTIEDLLRDESLRTGINEEVLWNKYLLEVEKDIAVGENRFVDLTTPQEETDKDSQETPPTPCTPIKRRSKKKCDCSPLPSFNAPECQSPPGFYRKRDRAWTEEEINVTNILHLMKDASS